MQAETEVAQQVPKKGKIVPSVLVLLGLAATGLLWEPLTGVFGQSVQFSAVGTAAFALWGIVAVAGLVSSARTWASDRSGLSQAFLSVAILLTLLAGVTWVVIIATGAIGTGAATSGPVPLK